MLARLRSLLRNLLQRNRMQRELDAELRAMFDVLTAEKIAAGMGPREAQRAAAIELGGIEPLKEQVLDVKMGVRVDAFIQDVRHALRYYRRAPTFATSV